MNQHARSSRPSHCAVWRLGLLTLCAALLVGACAESGGDDRLGTLSLGLTTEADGTTYRLYDARFALDGPEPRELASGDEDTLSVELPAGAYRLTLQPGYRLARKDDPQGAAIAAKLVSQNPAAVLVSAGETARVTLRFELESGADVALGAGVLEVEIEVAPAGSAASPALCASGLRINELDYEQASSDDGEFIELLNTSRCEAALEGVTLELVNGSDGKVYASYALAELAAVLGAGERLVLGDPAVLAALPAEAKRGTLKSSGLQNGPDALRLRAGGQTLDAVAYGELVTDSSEGSAAPVDSGEQALLRCPDGFDTNDGALDWKLAAPTPGSANVCP